MVILCFIAFSAVHIWWWFCSRLYITEFYSEYSDCYSPYFVYIARSLSLPVFFSRQLMCVCVRLPNAFLFDSDSVGRSAFICMRCLTIQLGYGYFHINNVHVFLIAQRTEYYCVYDVMCCVFSFTKSTGALAKSISCRAKHTKWINKREHERIKFSLKDCLCSYATLHIFIIRSICRESRKKLHRNKKASHKANNKLWRDSE